VLSAFLPPARLLLSHAPERRGARLTELGAVGLGLAVAGLVAVTGLSGSVAPIGLRLAGARRANGRGRLGPRRRLRL
jgi:hypothetical protein